MSFQSEQLSEGFDILVVTGCENDMVKVSWRYQVRPSLLEGDPGWSRTLL
jgi:hypothetical protein